MIYVIREAGPLRGEGGKGLATKRKKKLFLELLTPPPPKKKVATKLQGGYPTNLHISLLLLYVQFSNLLYKSGNYFLVTQYSAR